MNIWVFTYLLHSNYEMTTLFEMHSKNHVLDDQKRHVVPVQFFLPQSFYCFRMVYYCDVPVANPSYADNVRENVCGYGLGLKVFFLFENYDACFCSC